jgi:signal transduction histidine kinase/FixJ family two-component response regulator
MSAPSKPRVWLVEDSPLEADTAMRALQAEFDVTLFADGPSMLERLTQAAPPDVVLLDWHLPALTGIEICQFLRNRAGLLDIGILIVTGVYSKTTDIVQGLAAGANDYVVKPYVAEELAARVGAVVRAKLLRERAARAEETLQAVLEELPDALIAVDGEQRVRFINREAVRVFGDSCALGSSLPMFAPMLAPTLARLDAAGAELEPIEIGDRVFAPATRQLSLDERGPLTIITLRDITDARRQIDARDQFLAMLAHELRNPLAPIMTALDVLKMQPDAVTQRPRAIMERQVTRLVRLVDDLLDISRITRGQIELQRQPVDLAATLASAVEDTQSLLDAQHHKLVLAIDSAPLMVIGDSVRLEQIFTNLLNNAAKYTAPGGALRLEARRVGDDIVVRVEDNGIGIDPTMLPRIFDMFVQAETSLARSRGGLGIGLTLVNQLAQMHGGSVSAESKGKGHGSVFCVRLPASDAPIPVTSGRAALVPKSPIRVLVVDDNEDAAELLSAALLAHGHDVETANDGVTAIERAIAFRPGVILLDIGLPEMDGYAVAKRLRAEPTLAGAVIIGITGYGQADDRRRSAAAGFDEHLVKPVDLDRLWDLIATRTRSNP